MINKNNGFFVNVRLLTPVGCGSIAKTRMDTGTIVLKNLFGKLIDFLTRYLRGKYLKDYLYVIHVTYLHV
jgi:hypothetical protein